MRLRPRHHDLGLRERGLPRRQSLRPEQPLRNPQQLLAGEFALADAPEQRAQLAAAEPVLGGAGAPVLAQPDEVDVLLALARLDRRDLGGVEAAAALAGELLDHLRPPGRELADHLARHVPQLGHPLARLLPLDAERARQLGAQLRLVEVAGGEPVAFRIGSPSSARHFPSLGLWAMFATITCVCRCGSCARLVRCW